MSRPRKRQRGIKGRPWYRKHNDTWYIDCNGKQTPIKDDKGHNVKGADSREQAERCWVLMQAHMLAPEMGPENPVRLVFSRYLDHIEKDHPGAYHAYLRTLTGFAESLPIKDFVVRDLTAFHVDEWLNKHPKWSSTTKATYVTTVMGALNWAAEPHRRLIPANPIRGYKKPRRRSRGAESLVPPEAHQAFLDHVPEDFQVILKVLYDTGTRSGNICRVTAAHCDWENGGWNFSEENAVNGKVHKTFEQTGEGLFVPVSEEVMALCRKLADQYPEGPLFRTKEGESWDSDKVAQRFLYYRDKLAKAGVPMPKKYHAHGYRHTLATDLLESGVPDTVVGAIGGWKGTATLHGHYSHVIARPNRLTKVLREQLKVRGRNPQSSAGGEEPASPSAED
jgi:integrase